MCFYYLYNLYAKPRLSIDTSVTLIFKNAGFNQSTAMFRSNLFISTSKNIGCLSNTLKGPLYMVVLAKSRTKMYVRSIKV